MNNLLWGATIIAAPVIDELDQIRGLFAAASITGPPVLSDTVAALRTLLVELVNPRSPPASDDAVARLIAAIFAFSLVVAEAAEPHMRSDAIHLGLGAASRLVGLLRRDLAPGDIGDTRQALIRDWADHTALLAFELDALLLRRSIEARGDVFRRTIAIDRPLAATAAGQPLH